MSDADKSTDCSGISTAVRHCYGCTRVATLEARVAELTRERDEAAKLLGTVVCIGTLLEGEELLNDPRHAATDAILSWRSAALAARAERDEAVGLLERWMFWASGVAFKSELGEALVKDTDAYLAPAPEKETTPSNLGPALQTNDDPPTR